jgi:hypothetical protein
MDEELEKNIINQHYSEEISLQKIAYKYNYRDDFYFNKGETLESLKDYTDMKAISINDDYIGEMIYYEIKEIEYNCKEDMVREKTKRMGKVDGEIIYENIYDEKFNLIEKRLNRHSINTGDDVFIYLYENIYDENGRLMKALSKDENEEIYGTIDYEYDNKQLIRKEEKYKGNYNTTHYYYYNEKGILYEETVIISDEISCYYQYNTLEDGRVKKNLVNPVRGKYKWRFKYDKEDIKNCEVYMHEPILTADMIKEIMDYIIANYKDTIDCVIIDILNINLLYRYENPEIYNYYRDNYGIVILEDF